MATEFDTIFEAAFADLAVPFGDSVTFTRDADPTDTFTLTAVCSSFREDEIERNFIRDVQVCRCLVSDFTAETLTPAIGDSITDASNNVWTIREITTEFGWHTFILEKDIRVVPR